MFTEMNDRPDFAAIVAFAKVAETGSFRAAAAALAAPPSTVSVQVRRLEGRLGAKLFERSTRKVVLTEEGRAYFESVRAALEAVAEAEQALASQAARPAGRLRVASPVELGRSALGRVVGRYLRECPDVECQIELTDAPVDPLRDGFDVVLQVDPAESASLVARKLGLATTYRLFASPAYLARRGVPRRPRDLAGHACLVLGARGLTTTWRLARGGARVSIAHRHATANDWSVLRDLALEGAGVARLPNFLALPEEAAGRLRAVLDDYTPPPEQMHAVYLRSPFVPARVRGFVAALVAHFEVWPGCLVREPPARSLRAHAPHPPVA